jgi:hypothetical protein
MRVRKMRVLESASILVSTENTNTECASTGIVGTKVLSQDNASSENADTDNLATLERHGKYEYGYATTKVVHWGSKLGLTIIQITVYNHLL